MIEEDKIKRAELLDRIARGLSAEAGALYYLNSVSSWGETYAIAQAMRCVVAAVEVLAELVKQAERGTAEAPWSNVKPAPGGFPGIE